jgi:hypothetical protein
MLGSILCQKSTLDQETNNLSLIELIEELKLTIPKRTKPNQLVTLPGILVELITFFKKEDVTTDALIELETQFVDPNEKVISKRLDKLDYQKGHRRLRFRNRIGGLSLSTTGEYKFIVSMKDSEKILQQHVVPLYVTITEAATKTASK